MKWGVEYEVKNTKRGSKREKGSAAACRATASTPPEECAHFKALSV